MGETGKEEKMKSETDYLSGVDVLRFAATVAAIVLHSFLNLDRFVDLYVIGILIRWLVPVFFLTSGFFFKTDFKAFVGFMCRLVFVYAVWTAIYGLLNCMDIFNPYDFLSALRSGIVMPFWYYPTIISTLIFFWVLVKVVKKPSIICIIGAILFVGALIWNEFMYLPCFASLQNSFVMTVHHKIFGEVSAKYGIFWGTLFVAIGYALRCSANSDNSQGGDENSGFIGNLKRKLDEIYTTNRKKFWIILVVAGILYSVELCITYHYHTGDMDVLIMQIPFDTMLFIWALNCRIKKNFGVMLRGASTLMYLSHMFFIELIRPMTGTGVILAISSVAASFAFGWIIVKLSEKIKFLKYIY